MSISFWRSPETLAQITALDRSGFAVEFLRRNPAYRRDYARTQRRIARGADDPDTARAVLARRWGLCFCPSPGTCRNPRCHALAG